MAQRGHRHRQSEYLFRVSNTARGGAKHILTMCGERAARCPSAPQTSFHPFYHHLTPSRARIRRVEKLLPPSGPPPNTVALNPRTRMLKTRKNQGEHQHWTAHLSSMAAPEILIVLGLYARSRTRTQGESNPRALTRMNKGECYRSQVLHQSWPRKPPASNPLARLESRCR